MTFEELTTTIERKDKYGNITRKEYAEVNQRVKAFRFLFPEGTILTKMEHYDGENVIFTASAHDGEKVLATGTAWEKLGSSNVNRTSFIENAETSAVGRCLGFLGLGIDTSIASAEEVQNAELNEPVEEKYQNTIKHFLEKLKMPVETEALKATKHLKDFDEMTIIDFQKAMGELLAIEKKDNSKA